VFALCTSVGWKRGFFEKSIVLLPTPPRRPCNSTRPIDTMNERKKNALDIPRKNIYPNVCIDDLIRHFIKPIMCRSRNEPLFFFVFFFLRFFTTLHKYSDKTINYIYKYGQHGRLYYYHSIFPTLRVPI